MSNGDLFDLLPKASAIKVELDAYVLPDDHSIYKVSPGKTYRFYEHVRNANAIFLDVRGLGDLIGEPHEWNDDEVVRAIADDRWARELKSQARGNEPKGTSEISRSDRTKLGFLKALLGEAKKGDLIVVPAEGYSKEVLIGELLDEPWKVTTVTAQDGEDGLFTYIARRVRWRAKRPKRLFSEDMIAALHTQTAMFLIAQSLHEEIYRLAYRNFVYRNMYVAEFYTSKQHFTSEDSAVLSAWLNGFEFLRYQIESSASSLPSSFLIMGLSKLPDELAADLSININSPGSFVLKSKSAFTLALMTLLPLSACDAEKVIDDGVQVELKTVGSAQSTCTIEIEDEVKTYAETLSYKRLEEACELGRRAHDDAKVTTRARLK